jgi:hypothetical protein
MKLKYSLPAIAVSAAMVASAAGQTAFTAGNLAVLQVGADGSVSPLSNAAQAVFVKEVTVGGSVVQTIALPVLATVTGNRALTSSGTATSEGALTLSTDGRYLCLSGYNADAGTAAIASTSSSTVNRVVGRIDSSGVVDTSTAMSDAFTGNNIRGAASVDGSGFWVSGSGGSGAGVRYIALGEPTNLSTPITTTITTCRVVNIFNNQLYVSSASGTFQGVSAVGTGLPTTSGQVATLLPGFPTATGPSMYDYWFSDASTCYTTDDRSPGLGGGGITKWTFNGTTWSAAYLLSNGLTAGCRGVTGKVVGGVATLYVVSADGVTSTSGNKIMTVTDTDASASFSTILTAPGNTVFRGVDFAPSSGVPECYANCDHSTVPPTLNANDFQCFLNAFAAQDPYANCDNSSVAPILNANDFQCFLNTFAAGCT